MLFDDMNPIDLDFLHDVVDIDKIFSVKTKWLLPLGVRIQVTMRANTLSSNFNPPTKQVLT